MRKMNKKNLGIDYGFTQILEKRDFIDKVLWIMNMLLTSKNGKRYRIFW
jgi:hypothetical protein